MKGLFDIYEALLRREAAADAAPAMYVDRNGAGSIVNAWNEPQREGHERLPIDSPDLQAFLALPIGRFEKATFDQARWG